MAVPIRPGDHSGRTAEATSCPGSVLGEIAASAARYRDLGPGHHDDRISRDRKIQNHLCQLNALGLTRTSEGAP